MDDASATLTARQVPAKTLRVPSTVSPQLQRSISMLAEAARLPMAQSPKTIAQTEYASRAKRAIVPAKSRC